MKRLDAQTWKRLAPLLDEALELSEPECAAFVERQLGQEPELREILLELIAAERRADGPLEESAADLADSLAPASGPDSDDVPRVAGYTELHEIGYGGMGVVYRATRHGEGFEQEVALKVVRSGLDDAALGRRFERERSILAGLDHPNIARLLDGGSTEDGRSYFAMEYVDGVPVTRYADEHRLTVDQRLDLFEEVCAAVTFAQQHLIVHRDLKPSNILVDGDGRVRLLDFGIARLIDPGAESLESDLTREGSHLLTPEYAAPEQIRGEPPSTATDVYALGVILFELLSGRHPHGDTRAGALEFAMGMRESEWLPRAVDGEHRVLRSDGTVEVVTEKMVAAARQSTPRGLRRTLGGDLATIAAKALQNDPTQRYPSAEALLADLSRYRQGMPIEARAPSWSYRTRKYLRRHRTSMTATAVVILALAVGLGFSLWQSRVASRQAARAERAYDFLASLFEDAHPDAAQGKDWSAAELLERGAQRLANAWPDDPRARAKLQNNIADILIERGDYDSSERMLREALARDDTELRTDLMLTLARAEMRGGRFAAADSVIAVIDASAEPLNPQEHAHILEYKASLYHSQGSFAAAESLMTLVMDFTRSAHGENSPQFASDLNSLGTYQMEQARYDEAEASYMRALTILSDVHPRPLLQIAVCEHNLGRLYNVIERHDESKQHYRRAVELRREAFPGGSDRLADSLSGLASVYSEDGELDVADSLLSQAAVMTEASRGTDSDAFARRLNELAILAYRRQDMDSARERFARANAIFERVLGPTHPVSLTVTNNLATVQSMTGHLEDAEQTFRQVLERRVEVLGDEHPDVAFSYNSLGLVLAKLDRPQEAIEADRQALKRYLAVHGEEHPTIAYTRTQLGSALRDAGQIDEALKQLRWALAYREENLPEPHRDTALTRAALGFTLIEAGRWEEAASNLNRAATEVEEVAGADSLRLFEIRAALGLCLARQGEVEKGRALAESACTELIESVGEDHYRTKRAREYLSRI